MKERWKGCLVIPINLRAGYLPVQWDAATGIATNHDRQVEGDLEPMWLGAGLAELIFST